jgi:hypothetical protein
VGEGSAGKKAAQLAAEKIAARLALGDFSVFADEASQRKAPTFSEIAQEWLTKYPALHAIRPATLANYRSFSTSSRSLAPCR